MNDRDEFLAWVGSRLKDAETALHNGDAAPRLAIWSTKDPVTVLGAWKSGSGYEEVSGIFRVLEDIHSDCTSYSDEVIAAEVHGDMAYTAGHEHVEGSMHGQICKYTLRVTQVYRREAGEWKVVHRHADRLEDAERS